MSSGPLGGAGVVGGKELLETLRDRRTLLLTVGLPIVLYPVLFAGFGLAARAQQERLAAEELPVGLEAPARAGGLAEALTELEHSPLERVDDAEAAVRDRRVWAAVRVPEAMADRLHDGEQVELALIYDGSEDRSRLARRRLERTIEAWERTERRARLVSKGLLPDYADPAAVASSNVAPPSAQGGWILARVLPLLVSVLMLGAAFHPAVDLTAGEKERGTLQTLLTAPVGPQAIVVGKFAAVVGLALLTAVANLAAVGLVLALLPLPEQLPEGGEVAFRIAPAAALGLLVCLVLLGMLFGALMMAVAVTARSFKDAQSYLTPVLLVGVLPLAAGSLPGIELGAATAAVPLVNLALAMKALLIGEADPVALGVVILSSLVWTALALSLAARVFAMESVVLGHAGPSALLRPRRPDRSAGPARPTPSEAVVLLGVVLALLFYGSLALRGASLLVLVHVSQWGFLLAPTVGLVLLLRLDARATFGLRRPPGWAMAVAALCGGGIWYAALRLIRGAAGDWLPVPSPEMQEMAREMQRLGREPGTAVLLYLGAAVGPAVCEEALFRGVLLRSLLGRMRDRWAVLLSAGVFAAYHLSLHQLPTTFAVGVVMGALVVLSNSLWPAVLLHLLHNGLALASQLHAPSELLEHPAMLGLLAAPVVGLVLLGRRVRAVAGASDG